MKTTKIQNLYAAASKQDGKRLPASDWNALSSATRDAQTALNSIFADTVVLTNASQATAANKVYSVQSSIDLNGGTLTMPEDCTLLFEGGSISNGTLVLNNTRIEGEASFSNVTISGSCANEVLTPQMFGAVGGAESATPSRDTKGFKNLAAVVDNAGTKNKVIHIPAGHYAIDEKITILSGCTVYGDGDATVIDVYGGTGSVTFGTGAERCTLLEDVTVTANASKGDTSIQLNDASGISAGDYIIITDTVDYSFYSTRPYYRTSEVVKVLSVDQNTVNLDGALYGNYFTGTGTPTTIERDGSTLNALDFGNDEVSTMNNSFTYRTAILKFSPVKYIVSDFKIVSHAHENAWPSAYYTFQVLGHVDSRFKNITVINNGNQVGASIDLGIGFVMEDCSVKSYAIFTAHDYDPYGMSISHCCGYIVKGGIFRGKSHSLATGGSGNVYGFNNRDFVYDSVSFEDAGEYNGIELDVHANSEYYEFRNVDAPKVMCDTGGYHVTVTNCRFKDVSSTFHIAGLVVKDCELMSPIETLFYFNFEHVDYENASIVFENCKIHGGAHFNMQDGIHDIKGFVWRNNICEGLRIRRGRIKNVCVEGNVFTRGRILLDDLYVDNVSICNNNVNNGYVWVTRPDGVCKGIISNNIIVHDQVALDSTGIDGTIRVKHFEGFISNNHITSVNNQATIACDCSNVNISENIIKQGSDETTGNTSIFKASDASTVYLFRNTHNGGPYYTRYDYQKDGSIIYVDRIPHSHAVGASKPLGRYVYPGFMFIWYNPDNGFCKPIFAKTVDDDTVEWVDATGEAIS